MTGWLTLLVTGSRSWTSTPPIGHVLKMYTFHAFQQGNRLLVIHGDCGEGADAIARAWVTGRAAAGWPVDHDPHPADWEGPCRPRCRPRHRKRRKRDGALFCPAAGIYRDFEMCDLRPSYVEAFIRDNSAGASRTADYADQLGLAVHRTRWEQRDLPRTGLAQVAV